MTRRLLLLLASLTTATLVARAEEKQGIRLDVTPHMAENRSDRPRFGSGFTEIDKTMAMKVAVKNTSMNDMPEASLTYTFIVERWDPSEKGTYSSYTGTQQVKALRPADQVVLDVGTYKIGGHRHGTSPRHEDKLAGWKIVVTRGAQQTEFSSSSNFAALEARARSNP